MYCSDSASQEALDGTAARKRVWLVIEQPGPWGHDALLESSLPVGVGDILKNIAAIEDVGVFLARRPDLVSHERRTSRRRRFWLAHTAVGGVRMRSGSLDDIQEVGQWDFNAILRGELPPVGRRSADPVLFVCANGKRDTCCAMKSRPIIDALRGNPEYTSQFYESSHLGGHRFAPTGLLLPWGISLGRLTERSALSILDQAWQGKISAEHIRGRSAFAHWAQTAELAIRKSHNVEGIEHLDVVVIRDQKVLPAITRSTFDETDVVQVRHRDGRGWNVLLEEYDVEPRMVSCGKKLETETAWRVLSIADAPHWHS